MLISQGFQQPPLEIPPAFTTDPVFAALLERILPAQTFRKVDQELRKFEVRLAGPIRKLASTVDSSPSSVEPTLNQYDQWGRRVDELKTSEGWRELKKVAVEEGMVAIAMEREEGEFSRVRGFAKGYLFAPDGLYVGCPISMTDGAARVIELAGTNAMKRDILPRLISRDPGNAWIAGQWMTERSGGSDVSLTETVAHPVDPLRTSPGDDFILDGFKWFSSATDGDCALALARTGEEGSGSKGLSLFFVKLRDDEGKTNGVFVHRLKKKFGTKALPTAELSIENCRAQLIGSLGSGVRTISTVLNITRLHSAMSGVASLRRCLVLSKEYARTRHIEGNHNQLLEDNSMHTNALLKPELTHRALLHLVFGSIHLLGRSEALGGKFDSKEQWRLRLLTPVVKSFCAELSTTEMPDLMASLGGQGYMTENQFGRLIADANVERIWEGTTSVLSLDVVRVILQSKGEAIRSFIEWSRSILDKAPRNAGFDAAVKTTNERLDILQEVTKRYLTKQADPRLSRPLLFLIGYIASTCYLFEQAIWSNGQGRAEAELDKWIVAKWVESGGVKSNVAGLKGLLKASEEDIKEGMRMERALVYGLERPSKL